MKQINHLGDLTHDPQNARRHTPRNVGMLEKALNEVGAARSIVIDEDGVVLAGNATIDAAAQAGIERVRVVEADGNEIIAVQRKGLTPEQKVKLALYDNRVAELAEWDGGVLEGLGAELDLAKLGMFTADELTAIFEQGNTQVEQEDAAPVTVDESKPTRCQPGDIWKVGKHLVACLDSTEPGNVDMVLGGARVGFVWSDAPYGINAVGANGQTGTAHPTPFGGARLRGSAPAIAARKYAPVIGDDSTETAEASAHLCISQFSDAIQVWWGANHFSHVFPSSSCWLVWDKETDGNNFADCELAWTNYDGTVRMFRHRWQGMLRASEQGERIHPNQKPIALCEWAFIKYGTPGDIILDPFLGSGPSLKAAHRMGDRVVRGFELSPHYIDHILEWGESQGLEVELIQQH